MQSLTYSKKITNKIKDALESGIVARLLIDNELNLSLYETEKMSSLFSYSKNFHVEIKTRFQVYDVLKVEIAYDDENIYIYHTLGGDKHKYLFEFECIDKAVDHINSFFN
ncbi:gp446 [Bacillus phage G]|uniref:Gp446 n=1 Tax=Bacillus phage G TaxID=2884420 RepID=G3MAI7_9CAUD|nr:gp446 [Bacillus phage G]AEO93704.1 gp446 [Bacillus phage G]